MAKFFSRLKNFATVVPQKGRLLLYLHLDVEQIAPPPGIGRDVRQQGHWGTGDMELSLTKTADLDLVKPLILQAYEGRAAASTAPTLPLTTPYKKPSPPKKARGDSLLAHPCSSVRPIRKY